MRTQRRVLAALLTVGLVLAMASGGAADDASGAMEQRAAPYGPDFYVGGPDPYGSGSQPAVAWNASAGEYLVVWMDERDIGTRGVDIYGQRISARGAVIGGNFRISATLTNTSEVQPAVAWNATTNQYLVVWADGRDRSHRHDIYGQRLSATGALLGSDIHLSDDAAINDEAGAAVAWNEKSNQYLVVWSDQRPGAGGEDIYGQRLSATGALLGGNVRISGALATQTDREASVAWNGRRNQYLVVWSDRRNGPNRGYDIYGQRVAADGARLGGNFRISGAAAVENEAHPMVAWNADLNQYLVVWEDSRHGGYSSTDIYGRRLAAGGRRLGADFRISGVTWSTGGLLPALAWSSKSNQYLVVWQDRRNEPISGYDIYGQEVTGAGTLSGGNFRISGATATGHDQAPGIAHNMSLDQYLVVWDDGRDTGPWSDIWGRRVTG